MKRYTLKFILLDPEVTPNSLKAEVEETLLRLHPRIIFKMGIARKSHPGEILVEIASDGKRDFLEKYLQDKVWKVPARLDRLGWGWIADEQGPASDYPEGVNIASDPLSGIIPMAGKVEVQLSRNRLWGRYIFMLIMTLVMVFLLAANAMQHDSPALQWMYVLGFMVWLISISDIPVNPRVYANKITCGLEKLEISYAWQGKPQAFNWDTIWGVDFSEPICKVYSNQLSRRFILSERFGCQGKPTVLKTIIQRASLNFIEGNNRSNVYRRYEAGD
jgi:hypothetical protein